MKRHPDTTPTPPLGARADSRSEALDGAPERGIRRFPPVLQFLTHCGAAVEKRLRAAADTAYQSGQPLDQVCGALYHRALELGFLATIGVQEVYSTRMPSFPGETVWSVLLLIDLRHATAAA